MFPRLVGLARDCRGPTMDERAASIGVAVGACAVLMLAHYRRRRVPLLCEPCEEAEAPKPARLGHDPPASPTGAGERPTERHAPTPRQALLGGESPGVGLSKDGDAATRRDGYIDWPDYFMSVAMLSAFRSKDPSRQVGACIVDPGTKRIVGIGYNGFPWGCSDEVLPWARKADSWLDTKYPYVCHGEFAANLQRARLHALSHPRATCARAAELNAIMNKNTASLEGCRMYTTLFPCNECAKLIVQSRMREVVYLSDAQEGTDPNTASRRILDLAGVQVWRHAPAVRNVTIDFDSPLAK
jgi:dCMP deaminase